MESQADGGSESLPPPEITSPRSHLLGSACDFLLQQVGYELESAENLDSELALDSGTLMRFIKQTQPFAWRRLRESLGESAGERIVERVVRELDIRGTLAALKSVIKVSGVELHLAYFFSQGGDQADRHRYRHNILSLIPAVPVGGGAEIDLLLLLNGLPLASLNFPRFQSGGSIAELKRRLQTWSADPPLLRFKQRTLLHFVIDDNEVCFTTHLAGAETDFLPFNRPASACSSVTEPRSAHFWQHLLRREVWLELLGNFLHKEAVTQLDSDNNHLVRQERLIFPRYHQWELSRYLLADLVKHGMGQRRLIQHVAGSGKSKTLLWSAFQLSQLQDRRGEPWLSSVVLVSNRTHFAAHLQSAVPQLGNQEVRLEVISEGKQRLLSALNRSARLILMPFHKLKLLLEEIAERSEQRFVVLLDEPISITECALNDEPNYKRNYASPALAAKARQAEGSWGEQAFEQQNALELERLLQQVVAESKTSNNFSLYTFCATPSAALLELFGERARNGTLRPAHRYSVSQAIADGLLLELLDRYRSDSAYRSLLAGFASEFERDGGRLKQTFDRYRGRRCKAV